MELKPSDDDDQVGVGEFLVALDLVLEHQLDAELLAAVLQDVEHLLAADADEAVAAGADACGP